MGLRIRRLQTKRAICKKKLLRSTRSLRHQVSSWATVLSGVAGEIANVTQVFQPESFTFRHPCMFPIGKYISAADSRPHCSAGAVAAVRQR